MKADFAHRLVLKAVEEGEIAGSVRAHMKEGNCLIGRLIVRPDRQGRGIGQLLMSEIEKRFPQAESYRLFTGHRSEKALHIYAKMGYEVYRTEYLHENLTLIYMEKRTDRHSEPQV